MKSCFRTAHLERWEQKERRSWAQGTFGIWWHFYFYYETATEHCFRNWFDSTHAYEYNTLTLKKNNIGLQLSLKQYIFYWWMQRNTALHKHNIHVTLTTKCHIRKWIPSVHAFNSSCMQKNSLPQSSWPYFLKCLLGCIAMLLPKPQSNSQMKNRTWLWVRKGGKHFPQKT